MRLSEFLSYMNSGEEVIAGSDVHQCMVQLSQEARKVTGAINACYRTDEEIRQMFSELTGKAAPESFRLFPPFYSDCGKNIHIDDCVFINSGCQFQDQGGIYIGRDSFIGHSVVMATLNHHPDPDKRANMLPKPIHIGKSVWIGAHATILHGVHIGDGAIVAAGALVNRDVRERTLVVGVPAKEVKKL